MTASPRFLILYGTAGAGHRRAADAVAAPLRAQGALAVTLDVMPYTRPIFRAVYVRGGLHLITHWPRLYRLIYSASDHHALDRLIRPSRAHAQQWSTPQLLNAIHTFQPQAVICTHFLAAELCAGWRQTGQLRVPLITAMTDFEPHRMWQHAATSAYCVPTAEAAQRLARDGVESARVQITGIPIDPAFITPPDRADARQRLQLAPDQPVLLIMGGGLGVGAIERVAQALLRHPPDAQLVFITGWNRALRRSLRTLQGEWHVRGFVDNMPDWLAAADVAISKAGGLAASELLAAGVPTIVPRALTGHETRNAQYFAATGAARLADTAAEVVAWADRVLRDPIERAAMRAAALAAAKPRAAEDIARLALQVSEA